MLVNSLHPPNGVTDWAGPRSPSRTARGRGCFGTCRDGYLGRKFGRSGARRLWPEGERHDEAIGVCGWDQLFGVAPGSLSKRSSRSSSQRRITPDEITAHAIEVDHLGLVGELVDHWCAASCRNQPDPPALVAQLQPVVDQHLVHGREKGLEFPPHYSGQMS